RPAGSEGRAGTEGGQDEREPLHTSDLLLGRVRAYRRPAPRQSHRHRTAVAGAEVRPCPVLPALEGRRPLLHERADALAHVLALRDQGLAECFLGEAGVEVRLERAVEQPLREPERERGTLGEPLPPLARGLLELPGRHDLVHQPDPFGVDGRQVVAEEDQLLGLVEPHVAGEEERAAGVGGAAAPAAAREPERSAPVQNALPAPVSTTARTSGSSAARASASRNAWRISGFIAFRASGRLRTIHPTPFSIRNRSVSAMACPQPGSLNARTAL